jgi:hypothetical protein
MFRPKQVVSIADDPLTGSDKQTDDKSRTGVVLAESGHDDWANSGRYNVTCLTTEFNEYKSHEHTYKVHKDNHTENGSLKSHSLVCPWATVALPMKSLSRISGKSTGEELMLTDEGHEIVCRTVYEFMSTHNNYTG